MTPKEKAKELFDKMYFVDDLIGIYSMCFYAAKQCALIAVNEMIQETRTKYWYDVKKEIELL